MQELEKIQQPPEVLRELETNWQSLVKSIIDHCLTVDRNGRILAVDRLSSDFSPKAVVDAIAYDCVLPEYREIVKNCFDRVFQTGEPSVYEAPSLAPEGNILWFEYHVAAIETDQKVNALMVAGKNITDRKQKEAKLCKCEGRYRAILEDWIEPIARFKADGTLTFVNKAYCSYFGRTREESIGQSYETFFFETDRPLVARIVNSLSLENPRVTLEYRVLVASEVRWIQSIFQMIFDECNCQIEYESVGRDITALKQAEAALQETQANLQLTLQAAKLGSWQLDLSSGILTSSDQCKVNFGLPPDVDLSERELFQLIHPDDRERVQTFVKQAVDTRTEYRAEYRNVWSDGSIHWMFAFGRLTYAEDGTPLQMDGITLDITERKQAEQAIEFQANLLNQVQNAVICTDLAGHIIYWNRFAETLYQWTAEEVIGRQIVEVLTPLDRQQIHAELFADLQQNYQSRGEHLVRRKDGKVFPVLVVTTAIRDDRGQVAGFVGVSVDISDRKLAEAALQESEERYRTLAEKLRSITSNAPIYIYELDRNGRIIFANRTYKCATQDPILGTLLKDWFPDEQRPTIQDAIEKVFRTGQVQTGEYALPNPQGEICYYSTQTAPIQVDGSITSVVQIAIDITDRKKLELALQASEAKLSDIFNSAIAVISSSRIYVDRDNNFNFEYEYISAGCEALFGYTSQELMADVLLWRSRVLPEDLEVVEPLIKEAILAELSATFEYRFYHKNGSLRWMSVTLTSRRDEAANCWIATSVTTDINQGKQAEVALVESEARFRTIFETAGIGIVVAAPPDFKLAQTNLAYQKMLGYSAEELANFEYTYITHPDDIATEQSLIQTALEKIGKGYTLEKRYIRKDGQIIWVNLTASFILDAAGQIQRAIVMVEDITQRKQAEEALRESQRALSTLMGNLPGMAYRCLIDEPYSFEFASEGCLELTGYHPTDFYRGGRITFAEIMHPDDRVRIRNEATACLERRERIIVTYRIITANGEEKWLWDRAIGIYSPQGDLIAVEGFVSDITEQKLAQERIQFQANILSQVNDAAIAIDREERVTYWNQAAERLYNVTAEEMLGQKLKASYHYRWFTKEDEQAAHDSLAETGCWHGQNIHVKKNGEEILVESSVSVLKDKQGAAIGLLAVIRDITDRVSAEKKIREQAALLDITTDAILVWELNYQILFWNRGAERLYGWQAEEIVGGNFNQLLYRTSSPQVEKDWKKALRTVLARGEWNGEMQQVTKEGKDIIVQSRWTLMRDEAGQPKSILVVNTDITEKKQLETQFLRIQRLESLGSLASGIAHDLNNMLTPILAVAQLLPLKLPNLDEQNQQLLKMVEDSAKRGADLVNQILSFARGVEGKRTIVQVRHLLMEIKKFVKQTFPKSLAINTNIFNELWIVSADATQLHQVLMNLVINARDAMPNGGTLSISAENVFIDEHYAKTNTETKVGPYVAITVADTGTGIPEEIMDRIFEPFFTTKKAGAGTGLGLSTVISILKSHGGFVNIESKVAEGSQFKVFLPAIPEAAQTSSIGDLELPAGHGELVLVVDDEHSIREITKATLEAFNYRVITACDGVEAISLYVQYQAEISVVLIDAIVPLMSGQNAIWALKRIDHSVKVIACSGLKLSDKPTDVTDAIAFLAKPYTAQDLLDILHEILS